MDPTDVSDSISVSDLSSENPRSPSMLLGSKRRGTEMGIRSCHNRKRIKMRDLDSVFQAEEAQNHHSDSQPNKEAADHACVGDNCENTTPGFIKGQSMHSDVDQEITVRQKTLSLLDAAAWLSLGRVDCRSPKQNSHFAKNSSCGTTSGYTRNDSKHIAVDKDLDLNIKASSGPGTDLDVEDASSGLDKGLLCYYKTSDHAKSGASSECASSTSFLEENEPLRMWKAMKRNGFISSVHGGIPVPKHHYEKRKNKSNLLKKKMEIAKREQVNEFTKVAAPSGLLAGLNPGIINHVRNSKQVHSIIEAMVRSKKQSGQDQSRQVAQLRGVTENEIGFSYEDESCRSLRNGKTMPSDRLSSPSSSGCNEVSESNEAKKNNLYGQYLALQSTSEYKDENVAPKLLSATTVALGDGNCMPVGGFSQNEETITGLSMKAATVASRWLEILQQDLRGRLAALQHSKRRVCAVIASEFPCLPSDEFMSDQKNDVAADTHMRKWSSVFYQMDKTLAEEAKHLESWLKQVKELQLHCERGVQFVKFAGSDTVSSENSRSRKLDALEREYAVRAAAASIYSACNLVASVTNVSCF